jgi:diadenosine tetraphosphate (Ap4A) HIT family hydrolase
MECPFCDELASGILPERYESITRSRRLGSSPHFEVLADISPLVRGHLLIIPRAHITSFAAVPAQQRAEVDALVATTTAILASNIASPIIVEHGSGSQHKSGGCIDHAHLQIFPGDVPFADAMADYGTTSIDAFWDIARWANGGKSYLFYHGTDGRMLVADQLGTLPKQFIRRVIAKAIGLPDSQWDWRTHTLADNLKATVEQFAGHWA